MYPLAADMTLPPQVAARVGKGTYGQARDSESTAELSAHQQQVRAPSNSILPRCFKYLVAFSCCAAA